jgi:Macrocin-O-methyltransferase (TylF)
MNNPKGTKVSTLRRLASIMRRFAGDWRNAYDEDGLITVHNHDFLTEPRFTAAYARGVEAAGQDYRWNWRVNTGLWAAQVALDVPGDFIEFGVNRGFMSSAIMHHLDWNSTGRAFYLLDTFRGIDPDQMNEKERNAGGEWSNQAALASGFYTYCSDVVRQNFAEWPGATVIEGRVPETLEQVPSSQFALALIDMNCAEPEIAAFEFAWDRLSPGGLILLDDYGYLGYSAQKEAMDKLAAARSTQVLCLPTGQGLVIRPGPRTHDSSSF